MESLGQKYERRIKEADVEYAKEVAHLNEQAQSLLKPHDKTYEDAVKRADAARTEAEQTALAKFDADTAWIRKELEAGIEAASTRWANRTADALQEWHRGMEVPE